MKFCEDCNEQIRLRNTKGNLWRRACLCDWDTYEPSEPATIIVPSRYPDIFSDCVESVNRFAPKQNKILVRDGYDIVPPDGWTTIQGPDEKFIYSRNINLGISQSTGDVLLTNDDVRFTHPRTVETLQAVLAKHPEVGIISPLIKGEVGEYWQSHADKTLHHTEVRLCFVCVLIRREVIDKIGLLDESFDGYGYDDVDYCRRIKNAGWKLGVTARSVVKHGHVDGHMSTSFRRESQTMKELDAHARDIFRAKWGDEKLD